MKKFQVLIVILSLLMTGCNFPGLGGNAKNDGMVIAGGNTTERQVLTEIMRQMIKHYIKGAKTDTINNLGSTFLIVQSVNMGSTNMIGANYTGTSLTGELGMEATTDPKEAFEKVVRGYDEQMDMIWFPSYGFANTYAFMVTKDFAKKHSLTKVSDLEKINDKIKVGVDTGWLDRPGDGYEVFKELYDFSFDTILPMEIGLVYDAVRDGKMDVVLGYSTDGRIKSNNLVLLEDDKRLFPPYDASPVVKKDVLEKYPILEEILLRLEGEIDSTTMQELNRLGDEEKIEPQIIAGKFLKENNYFEDKEVIPLRQRPIYKDILEGR